MSALPVKPPYFSIQKFTATQPTAADAAVPDLIEVYLVLKGRVVISHNKYQLLLEGNMLYCHHVHDHCRVDVDADTEGYIIHFNKALVFNRDKELYYAHFPAFDALVQRGELIHAQAAFGREGKKLCELMCGEFESEHPFKMQILGGFLSIFLLHLMRMSKAFVFDTESSKDDMLVREFNILLERHFRRLKKVSDYAALLFMTTGRLNRIIKQVTGNSAGYYIRQRIVLEAVRHAKLSGASMKEIAYELGFSDHAHFSKFFKKVAGHNFSEVRITRSLLNYSAINKLDEYG